MDTSTAYRSGSDAVLAEGCQWSPPPPREFPAPVLVYPLPSHMPTVPAWAKPAPPFRGAP